MQRYLTHLLAALVLVLPALAVAQKVPIGPTIELGPGASFFTGSVAPAVEPGGNFVIVWNAYATGYDDHDVFAQRFDSAGTKLGTVFTVNTYTTANQGHLGAAVASDGAGNFVVVWTHRQYESYPVSDPYVIMGQRFDSAGRKLGGEFQVSTAPPCYYPESCYSYRFRPAMAADAAGNFVVAWTSYGYADPPGGGDGNGTGIIAQRFDSAATKLGGEFQVNTYTTGYQGSMFDTISVASDAAGNFVVVWPNYDDFDVFGQRYDSTGNRAGGEFQVTPTDSYGMKPHVASDAAGNFVVVWSAYPGIFARRYDSTGAEVGGEFLVSTYTTGDQGFRGLDVASDPAGNFVVTWYGEQSSGDYGIAVQQFDSTGAMLGGEYLLGRSGGGGRHALSVATDADGDFVVAWLDYDDGVMAQRFDDPPLTCASLPRNGCRQQTNERRGAFRFRDPGTNPKRKSITWRSATIEATAFADFGNPFAETDYVLCVYDASADDQPVLDAYMPAGGICNVIPCWTELSPPGKTIRYLDNLGTPDGIKMMLLRGGEEGKARVGLRGRGETLTLSADALTPPVIVQVQASNGLCFTARYEERIRKNEPGKFVGRPGSPSGAFLDGGAAVLD